MLSMWLRRCRRYVVSASSCCSGSEKHFCIVRVRQIERMGDKLGEVNADISQDPKHDLGIPRSWFHIFVIFTPIPENMI